MAVDVAGASHGSGTSAATNEPPDPVGAARILAERVRSRGLEIEQNRRLPPDLVQLARDLCLFDLATGGAGPPHSFVDIVAAVEEISSADGSTGWTVLIGNTNVFLAWLVPAAAAELAGDLRSPVLAGSMAPLGVGVPIPGGYRVTGRWPFASGSTHADVMMGGFVVHEDGRPRLSPAGQPETRVAFFPAASARVIDTWHVAGLAGTASNDVSVQDLDVPAAMTAAPANEPPVGDAPLVRLTPFNILMVLLAGYPLGVAARALEEIEVLCRARRRPGNGTTAIEDPEVQLVLTADRSRLAAARGLVFSTFEETWNALSAGRELTTVQRGRLAAAVLNAIDVGCVVVDDAFHLGGAGALFEEHPLQRCFRDLYAARQHVAFGIDSRLRIARACLGLGSPPALFAP